MGLITRLYDFVDGEYAYADQVDAEINQILTELNGNIANSNISGTAGILGTKIAIAPNGIPENRHNDESVTTTKLGKKPSGAARANINIAAIGEAELDYTDAKIPHMGDTEIKIARGVSDPISTDIDLLTSQAIVFSTDSDDGDPSFVETPRIILSVSCDCPAPPEIHIANITYWKSGESAAGFTFFIGIDMVSLSPSHTFYVTWEAIGK